jgi:hypothetical protein
MTGGTGAARGCPPEERTMDRPEHGSAPPSWRFRSYLELGPWPTAVPCARGHARLVMAEWGLAYMADPIELVVSELVTNGLRASAGLLGSRFGGRWSPGIAPVRMWLASDRRTVLVQVWDGNDRMPERKEPSLDSEGGRGLLVVEALSEAHGASGPNMRAGKSCGPDAGHSGGPHPRRAFARI